MSEQEIWKDIDGYNGYQVSNLGRIRSCHQGKDWRLQKPTTIKNGYKRVKLAGRRLLVHRLVAMAFVDGYRDGLVVNHKNENPADNRASNLEWVTQTQNMRHGTGPVRRQASQATRIVIQKDANGNEVGRYLGIMEAERKTGICSSSICGCFKGRRKTAGGYYWNWENKTADYDIPDVVRSLPDHDNTFKPIKGEVWRDVPGYEGYYRVSNLGRVRSLNKAKNGGLMLARSLRGHLRLTLHKDGKPNDVTVGFLVAIAFIGGYKQGMIVRHKNGVLDDNRADNLEWYRHQRAVIQYTLNGDKVAEYESITDAIKALGKTNGLTHITCCCDGKRYSSYGFRWQWKQKEQ